MFCRHWLSWSANECEQPWTTLSMDGPKQMNKGVYEHEWAWTTLSVDNPEQMNKGGVYKWWGAQGLQQWEKKPQSCNYSGSWRVHICKVGMAAVGVVGCVQEQEWGQGMNEGWGAWMRAGEHKQGVGEHKQGLWSAKEGHINWHVCSPLWGHLEPRLVGVSELSSLPPN